MRGPGMTIMLALPLASGAVSPVAAREDSQVAMNADDFCPSAYRNVYLCCVEHAWCEDTKEG